MQRVQAGPRRSSRAQGRRLVAATAIAVALALVWPGAANATLTGFSWTLSDYHANAYADSMFSMSWTGTGATPPLALTMPAGWRLAEADTTKSPFGANSPANNDIVGTGTVDASFAPFCTMTLVHLTGTWVKPIGSGAPANAVGQINWTSSVYTAKTYVEKTTTGQYVLDLNGIVPLSLVCSSTNDFTLDVTLRGTVANTTHHMTQNPAATGTYTICLDATHCASVTII